MHNGHTVCRACKEHNCCVYIEESLNRFAPSFPLPHVSQQAHAIFTPEGKSAVDFIAQTESIDTDWPEIFKRILDHSGQQATFQPLDWLNGASTNEASSPHQTRNMHSRGHRSFPLSSPLKLATYTHVAEHGEEGGVNADDPRCVPQVFADQGLLNETTAYNIARQMAIDMQVLGYPSCIADCHGA